MRVLHLSSALSWRGGEQQIAWLFQELKKQGIEQWIACVKDSVLEEWCLRQDFPVLSYTKRFSADPIPGLLIRRFCQKENIDLIHIHDSHAHTYAIFAASLWGNKTPMVLSRRVDFPIQNNFFSHWKYNHPRIRSILCVSKFIREILAPDIKDPQKLVVVHDGIDLQRFGFVRTGRLHKELGLAKETLLIGNVAAIAPHKDYFTFVDTVAVLKETDLPLHFLIIGADGGEQEAIEKYIKEKHLTAEISLLGFRPDVPVLLPELSVFLFTSKTEGLGSSILDAFACQIPVVATAAGGIPEILIHEKNGLLVPIQQATQLAEQVLRLLQENGLAEKLSSNAFASVQNYSCAAMASQTLDIYQKTLAKS